jgi:hypothetical protein
VSAVHSIAADLHAMKADMQTRLLEWPPMDEEELPVAAVLECIAILEDAAQAMSKQERA